MPAHARGAALPNAHGSSRNRRQREVWSRFLLEFGRASVRLERFMGQSLVKGPPTLAHGRARSKRKSRVGFRAGPVLPQSPPVAFSSAGWRVIKRSEEH